MAPTLAPKGAVSLLSPRALHRFQAPFQDPLELFSRTSRAHESSSSTPPPPAPAVNTPTCMVGQQTPSPLTLLLLPQGLPGPPGPKVRVRPGEALHGWDSGLREEGKAALQATERGAESDFRERRVTPGSLQSVTHLLGTAWPPQRLHLCAQHSGCCAQCGGCASTPRGA